MTKQQKKQYIFEYKMGFVNVLSIIIIIILILLMTILYKMGLLDEIITKSLNNSNQGMKDLAFYIDIILIILWLILHEIIHSIFYILMGAKSQNITYGIIIEKGIFFTKCGENITKKNVLVSVIAPFIILGILTLIISLIVSSPLLLILSLFNIAGCSGDLMMFDFFRKRKNDLLFRELNDSTTFAITTCEDLTDKKFCGVKLLSNQNLPNEDECYKQKIYISKPSKWIILILLIVLLLSIISVIL